MESTKVDETQRVAEKSPTVVEMGRVSEETKGGQNSFESLNPPRVGI